ncbi:hypothetical protein KR093_001175, partial [Drosophila rubida]
MTPLQMLLFMLFILSAFQRLESYKYYTYNAGSTPHLVSRRSFNKRHTIARRTDENQCHHKEEITNWINEQVLRNAKLTRFNQRLKELLDAVNANHTNSMEKGHCCFYEKNALDKVFADITMLSEKYNIAGGTALKASGDIGKDLDQILDRLKQLAGKDLKSCCDQITDKLKELEADFAKKLKDLQNKLNENQEDEDNQANKLEDTEQELKNKLEQLKEQMAQLEKKQLDNTKNSENGTCCKELEGKITELKAQVEAKKSEKFEKELEKALKDLMQKQKKQDDKVNDINEELKKNAVNVQQALENCKKQCGHEEKGNETIGKMNKENENYDSKKLDDLEKKIQALADNHKKLNDMLANGTQCKQPTNNATKTEEAQKGLKRNMQLPDSKSTCDNQQMADLAQIEKARKCCKDIEKLDKENEELRENIEKMNKSYTGHITQLSDEIKQLQDSLKEALRKPENSHQQENGKENNKDPEISKNPQLDKQLEEINKKIEEIQKMILGNANKLKDAEQKSNKELEKLSDRLENQKNASEKFEKNAEERFNALNSKGNTSNPVDKADRLDRLEKEQNQLSEDIDKALELQKRVEDMEKQLREAINTLQSSKPEVDQCSIKCKQLDNMDNLIDRIEDLEMKAK